MKVKFAIIVLCLLFFSCKRDPPIPQQGVNCIDISDVPPFKDTTYNTPRFNPNNPNEIIYVQGNTTDNKVYLVKKDLITEQSTYIMTNVWGKPDWSVKDWVVFNHADNQVWKIKSNGDSLQQLTSQGGLEAIWNHSGDKIAYWNQVSQFNTYSFITDINGTVLDTLFYPFSLHFGAWSYDNTKIVSYCFTYDVGYIDLNTKQVVKITNSPPDNEGQGRDIIRDIDWMPDSQNVIWCNGFGIFKTSITTKQTLTIKLACGLNKFYNNISVSPDGKKIIARRIDITSGLCLMDIDGKNEVIIK